MKNSIVLTSLCFLILAGCENGDKVPQLTTTEITQIKLTRAVSGGNITEDNFGEIILTNPLVDFGGWILF